MKWLSFHGAALARALARLSGAPLNTFLAALVIGIAVALPAAGWLALDNLERLGRHLAQAEQLSVFLKPDAGADAASAIGQRLKTRLSGNATADIRFVPKAEALAQLKAQADIADLIDTFDKNPLPDAYILSLPKASPESLEALQTEISGWPQVAHVQLDSAWVKRFHAFLGLGRLVVKLIAALFAAGLVAITFNTIRLQVLSHADEIEVSRLIGATDAFILRPFLYFGALQGAIGGLLGGIFASLCFLAVGDKAAELAALYGSQFTLSGFSFAQLLGMAGIGAVLGFLGAQLSVGLSLRGFD
jgi:cell division transport system permease protein